MKKLLSLTLALVMCLSLCACGGGDKDKNMVAVKNDTIVIGDQEDEEYEEIIRNPRLYYYDITDKSNEKLNIWFGNDSALRKEELMNPDMPQRIYSDATKKVKKEKEPAVEKPKKRKTTSLF